MDAGRLETADLEVGSVLETAFRRYVRDPRSAGEESGRACRGEREPAAGTLTAAGDRPDRRSTAAFAERRHDRRQGVPAAFAELRAGLPAREAALRKEEIEQDPTLAGQLSLHRADFVSNSARAASSCSFVPMSYHVPGSSQT